MTRAFALRFCDHSDTPAKKRFYNERLFTEVAPRYDFITRALSLGRDATWKRRLVGTLPEITGAARCVDLACGTGDVTRLLADRFVEGMVTGIDLTLPMLHLAGQRSMPANVGFRHCDMCNTGIESDSVDVVTGSYALRNAPDLSQALREVRRILKPGGTAGFLEFSKPAGAMSQFIEYRLLRFWGGLWGLLLHGNAEVYAYIAESLKVFPDRAGLHQEVSSHGFTIVSARRFCWGMLEMLIVRKDTTGRERPAVATHRQSSSGTSEAAD